MYRSAQTPNKSCSKKHVLCVSMARIKVITFLKVTLSGHLILLNKKNVHLCRGRRKTSYFTVRLCCII
jgi:hypothetical protein